MSHPPDEPHPDPALIERVEARRHELTRALAETGADRAAIEVALAELALLLPGDLEPYLDVVSQGLVRWLEAHRFVGMDLPAVESGPSRTRTRTRARAGAAGGHPAMLGGGETDDADRGTFSRSDDQRPR